MGYLHLDFLFWGGWESVPMVGGKGFALILIVTVMYLVLFAVTFWALMPLQAQIAGRFSSLGEITTFLVLPHGFRVILTWLWRHHAISLLLPGTAIQALIITEHYGFGPADWLVMVLSFSCSSFVTFEIAKWSGMDAYASQNRPVNWRAVFVVGALAALINGVINLAFGFGHLSMDAKLWLVLNFIIGGMTGLVAWLLIVRFGLRHLTRYALRFPLGN